MQPFADFSVSHFGNAEAKGEVEKVGDCMAVGCDGMRRTTSSFHIQEIVVEQFCVLCVMVECAPFAQFASGHISTPPSASLSSSAPLRGAHKCGGPASRPTRAFRSYSAAMATGAENFHNLAVAM
jgi:hypothetical protein